VRGTEPEPRRSEAEVDRRMDELLEELRARRKRVPGRPDRDALTEIDRLLDRLDD